MLLMDMMKMLWCSNIHDIDAVVFAADVTLSPGDSAAAVNPDDETISKNEHH